MDNFGTNLFFLPLANLGNKYLKFHNPQKEIHIMYAHNFKSPLCSVGNRTNPKNELYEKGYKKVNKTGRDV